MRAILDTHTLIWAQDSPVKLGVSARSILSNPTHQLLLSTATIWEIGIKVAIGKLKLSLPYRTWIEKAFLDLDLIELPIELRFVDHLIGLPFHHRDPFDRMLASQALVEGIPLIGGDAMFDAYGIHRIWN